MRNIGILSNQIEARRFSHFLRNKGIQNTCEISLNREKNVLNCAIWVHEEDQREEAEKYFEEFVKNPSDPKFQGSFTEEIKAKSGFSAIESPASIRREEKPKNPTFPMMYFFLIVCALVFFINAMQEMSHSKKNPLMAALIVTPIESALLYDAPISAEKFNQIIDSFSYDPSESAEKLSVDVKKLMRELDSLPYFRGFYHFLISKVQGEKEKNTGPLFVKIRQGQIWRVFSPCILHKDLLHILFNMLWLWVLGKQIELRLPKFRMFVLIFVIGIFSNLMQYLMSGPYFLGFSGIIMGMAGFIWMRQKIAPWEGYPLNRSTMLFLGVFIAGMFFLQLASFLILVFGWGSFSPNIANTAHIAGALIGALLGKMPYFSWRALER